MATERLSNLGYCGMIKEVTPGTPLTPTDYVPLYEESISTDGQFQDLDPAYGGKFNVLTTIPGTRQFKGDLTILAEPNTASRIFDATLNKVSSTGSAPTTHVYALNTTNPATYTYDLSLGNIVKRYWGLGISKVGTDWSKNELRLKLSASALGSFEGRSLASTPTGAGPYTVVFDDPNGIFDQNPTKGLVAGDLIRFYKVSTGATIDAAVLAVTNGTTITTSTNVTTMAAGDAVYLRPATPAFNNLQSFMWDKTRVGFGLTASAALSATHTPIEPGSSWEIMHSFNDEGGEDRSGAFGPAALVRTTGDLNVTIKKICDTPEDELAYNSLSKQAVVWRHFAGPTNQYELRVTINHTKMDNPIGNLKSGSLVYVDQKLRPNYDTTDSQAFDVKVLNTLTAI